MTTGLILLAVLILLVLGDLAVVHSLKRRKRKDDPAAGRDSAPPDR